jgi:hypothetical protein
MKHLIILLFTTLSIAQSSIVASGSSNITIGEVFPIMQQVDTIVEVSLSVPKYEVEQPKPIVKKKLTWWQKLLKAIFG